MTIFYFYQVNKICCSIGKVKKTGFNRTNDTQPPNHNEMNLDIIIYIKAKIPEVNRSLTLFNLLIIIYI